jgi:hypothetical protein
MYWFLTDDLRDENLKEFKGHSATSGKRMWTTGVRFDTPFPPEEFEVAPQEHADGPPGNEMPDIFDSSVPIMSKRLLDGLAAAGVDNIDRYPVRIVDKSAGENWDNYFAVNVLGRVDALDREKTKTERDIESLNPCYLSVVIDPLRAGGLFCFRLHKGPRELVIHERVARLVPSWGCKGLGLVRTEDFSQG